MLGPTEENHQLTEKLAALQKQYEENERHMQKSIGEFLLNKPSITADKQNEGTERKVSVFDVPDYNVSKSPNLRDSRLTHKPLSVSDIVETVVDLQR